MPKGSLNAIQSYKLISTYGVYDRDFRKKLGMKYPRMGALSWLKILKGRMGKRMARRHVYYYYEEGQWAKAAVTIKAKTNVDADTVRITLEDADHDTLAGAKYSYPVKNQLAVFENETVGFVEAVDKSGANHTVDILQVNASQDVQGAAAVGGTVVFYSNAQKEKSGKTDPRVPQVDKVTNYIQTFREYCEITDHEAQQDVEFEYKGQQYLYNLTTDDTADRFELQEEQGLLITPLSDANLKDADGNVIQTAQALIPQIDAGGKNYEYFDSISMTDFDNTILLLQKNYGAREYVVGRGVRAALKMKNFLIEFAKNGDNDISFDAFESREQALAMKFRSIAIESWSFHFQDWEVLSHPDTLGAGNMKYPDMCIFIPTEFIRNPSSAMGERVGEEMEPYLKLVYSPPQGAPNTIHGDYKLWEDGADAKSGPTNDVEYRGVNWISYKSLEMRRRNAFLLWRKAA